jgi:hypothetical protein
VNVAKSNKERFAWMTALLAKLDTRHIAALRVGIRLGLHFNGDTGLCNPGVATLQHGTQLSERAVETAKAFLKKLGWIDWRPGGGRSRSNQYLLLLDNVALETPHENAGFSECLPPETPQQAQKNPAANRPKPRTPVRPNKNENMKTKPEVSDGLRGFEDWWQQYPRKKAKGSARKAYAKALKAGATAEQLMNGAMRYAAERTEKDPKFTKHPATWLNGECWTDEPEATDVAGTIRADRAAGPNKPSASPLAAAMGAELARRPDSRLHGADNSGGAPAHRLAAIGDRKAS